MKLIYRIISRISIALLVLFTVWAALFYYIIIDEINDEADDSLEDYSEQIIMRALAGEELPSVDNGTNNSYYIRGITAEYAAVTPRVEYLDQEVYIESRKETEPARVLRTIFRDTDGRYHELTVLIPTFEKEDLKETILSWIVVLYVILLLAIIAVNTWIIYRSFKPLYALLNWLDDFTLGKDIPPLNNDTKVAEFRRLNEAMLRNAQRNNEMYKEQQSFIGNASHEIQTPIAICMNRLEILSDDPALTESQLEEIIKTRQSLDHISKLNRTLLLLTKIENRQFPESSVIDVNRLIRKLTADYSEVYSGRKIDVLIEEDTKLNIVMNDTLASILFSNLLKNAWIHSPEGAAVIINIGPRSVSISNTAVNGALDAQLIFKRFQQSSKHAGSMGLGLSLVESVCRHYGIEIRYDYIGGRHRFTVSVPINYK